MRGLREWLAFNQTHWRLFKNRLVRHVKRFQLLISAAQWKWYAYVYPALNITVSLLLAFSGFHAVIDIVIGTDTKKNNLSGNLKRPLLF